MTEDINHVAGKLRRWETYLDNFRLPRWNDIPDIGLFMDQVITLLTQYLDYLPPELKEDSCITPAAINNYVRLKIMPEPRKKRYYRLHIAYHLMICTMKQTLSIALIQKMVPMDCTEEEFSVIYNQYALEHRASAQYFIGQIRSETRPILDGTDSSGRAVSKLVFTTTVVAGFTKLLAEKLILLTPPEETTEEK